MKHSFQEMDLGFFECNPFDKIGKDTFVITSKDGDKVNVMAANCGGFGMMWGKKVVYLMVRASRLSKENMDKSERISLTFFENTPSNHMTLKYIGNVSGRQEDKIANAKLTVDYFEDVPYIDEGNLIFIARKLFAGPVAEECITDPQITEDWYKNHDDHTLYIMELEHMMAR